MLQLNANLPKSAGSKHASVTSIDIKDTEQSCQVRSLNLPPQLVAPQGF
jgi:hypothetical protein